MRTPGRPVICCSLGHCESGQEGPVVVSGDAAPRVKGRVKFKSGLFPPVGAGFHLEPELLLLLLLSLRISGATGSPPRSWRLISPGARGVLEADTIGRFDTCRSGQAAAEIRCSRFKGGGVPGALESPLHPSWLLFLKGSQKAGV